MKKSLENKYLLKRMSREKSQSTTYIDFLQKTNKKNTENVFTAKEKSSDNIGTVLMHMFCTYAVVNMSVS